MFVHNNNLFLRLVGAILVVALANFPAAAHQAESTQPNAINATLVTATGTVAELTVKSQLTGVTLRYFGLKVDQGESYALTGSGLDTLTDGSRVNVTGTLTGNIFNVTLVSSVAPADSAARATLQAKTKKSVSGTLAVYHKDFFQQSRGEYGLAVREASGKSTQLNVAAIPDSLEIGMLVSVDGTPAADGSSLDTSSITILAPAPAQLNDVAATPVTNNVLVLPIKFTDSAADPFTVAQINTEFQTRVGPYYQEVSYGQQLLNITVATSGGGWLNAGVPTPANCDWTTVGNLADAAATVAGYSINGYQNRYYVMTSNGACGWAGLAYVGFGRAWSNGVNALWVYGHELGHNFGLWHSGSLSCSGQVIGGSCGVNEYGDPFDAMGNIYPGHFNSMQKSVLGWISASSVKTHTAGSATYTLSPLETSGQSIYAVKIPAASNRTYWIEYRQPVGVDSGIASSNGAQIRVAAPFQFPCTNCGGDDTQILDMTLGTPGSFGDAALLLNQTYNDATYNISVTVTGVTTGPAGTLTLSVTAPGGGAATTTTLVSSLNPSTVGASVTFTASVTGTAPTGSMNFTDGGATISGCGAVALAGAGNTRTAACSTGALSSGTRTIVAAYSGDGANNASSSAPLSQVVNKTGTTTALSSSANPSTVGTSVTFTASVTGNGPTGTLNFTDGGSTISGCGAAALTGAGNTRTAVCSTAALSLGTHTIVAAYSGDGANNPSSSAPLSQVVNSSPTASTTTLISSLNPSTVGVNVTFTANVAGTAPTGSVNFKDGVTSISGCAASAIAGAGNSRSATCTTSSLSLGSHSIVASYSGDAGNTASSSAGLSQVVNGSTATIWVEDAVPSGATVGSDGGDGWNWVSSNPTPFSGSLAHQSAGGGQHQHYFYNATTTLAVGVGDTLFTYVYLDPANPPTEVMLQWSDGSWAHRAYWGANSIGAAGNVTQTYMGGLPPTGQWIRLAVAAAQVGLEGKTLNGMAFTLQGGRATWDYAGKDSTSLSSSANPSLVGASVTFAAKVTGTNPTGSVNFTDGGSTISGCGAVALTGAGNVRTAACSTSSLAAGSHSIVANYSGDGANAASSSAPLSQFVTAATATIWVEDSVPSGATVGSDGGDGWNWISGNPTPYSGALAHQSAGSGQHQHYFYNATATLAVGVGDTLFTYVYLDPANPPTEVMLQWSDGSWGHRAYWGANIIGAAGNVTQTYMGGLPPTGQWVRLAVPAAQVGLEGKTINGMAFTLYGGRATWDYAGK